MLNTVIEAAQPYITSIVLALIGLLASVVLAGINKLKARVEELLNSRLSESQRALLHTIASEAFAYAETEWKGKGGDAKLTAAMQYVLDKLGQYGIAVTAEEIQSAIHAAWIAAGGNKKDAVTTVYKTDAALADNVPSPDELVKNDLADFKSRVMTAPEQAEAAATTEQTAGASAGAVAIPADSSAQAAMSAPSSQSADGVTAAQGGGEQ